MIVDDLMLAIGVLRAGTATPGEQRAVFRKISLELSPLLRKVERSYSEIVANAQEDELRRVEPDAQLQILGGH